MHAPVSEQEIIEILTPILDSCNISCDTKKDGSKTYHFEPKQNSSLKLNQAQMENKGQMIMGRIIQGKSVTITDTHVDFPHQEKETHSFDEETVKPATSNYSDINTSKNSSTKFSLGKWGVVMTHQPGDIPITFGSESYMSSIDESPVPVCSTCGTKENISRTQKKKYQKGLEVSCLECIFKGSMGISQDSIKKKSKIPVGSRHGNHCCLGGSLEDCLKPNTCTFKHYFNLIRQLPSGTLEKKKLPLDPRKTQCGGCRFRGEPKDRPGCSCFHKNHSDLESEGWMEVM
jgi:hypothetical protein